MSFLYIEPQVTAANQPVTLSVQAGYTSGLSFSGMSFTLAPYGITDVQFLNPAGPTVTVLTDEHGNAQIPVVASSLGSTNVVLHGGYSGQNTASYQITVDPIGDQAKLLDDLFCAFKCIPRYEEPGRVLEDGHTIQFGWGHWHTDPAPEIMKNTEIWIDGIASEGNEYWVDYQKGRVYLKNALNPGDDIRATYSFRMIDFRQYQSFLAIALININARPPQTFFTFDNMPTTWPGTVIMGAYDLAAKCLLTKMQTFRYRRLFENPDGLIADLRQNANDARAMFLEYLVYVKRRGLTTPLGVTQYSQNLPTQVDQINYAQFTILR